MTQIERICRMEQILDAASEAAKNLSAALESYLMLRKDIAELEAYYTGPQWMRDYQDDCEGKLPKELKRGVLSEDAVYDLLSMQEVLREKSRDL